MESPATWQPFGVLLIDLQRDFWDNRFESHFPQFPGNVTRLLTLCRAEGIEIFHLRSSFQPDQSDWMARYRLRGKIPCIAGSPGSETLPFGREEPGETVLVKHTFDGFFNPALLEILKRKGKRFLLTAGLITSTCVLFTTTSAMQHGFLTTLVEDCCADEPDAHEQTLKRYPFIFGKALVSEIPERRAAWMEQIQKLEAMQSASR